MLAGERIATSPYSVDWAKLTFGYDNTVSCLSLNPKKNFSAAPYKVKIGIFGKVKLKVEGHETYVITKWDDYDVKTIEGDNLIYYYKF